MYIVHKMNLVFSVFLLTTIAPNIVEFSFAAPTLENEISKYDDDVKAFRSSYALRMKSYMNMSVDPCDDFYGYACGNYRNVIDDIEVTFKQNGFYDVLHALDEFIDKILQKERQVDEQYYQELQKVKHYVDVCDSAKLFPMSPSDEYLKVVNAIGGFPAVDPNWNASAFDWFNMTAHLIRYGVDGLVKEKSMMGFPFYPYYEIPKFGFDFDVLIDNIATKESDGYVYNANVMRNLLEVYGVSGSKADNVIDGVVEFWKEAVVYQNQAINNCEEVTKSDNLEDYLFPQWYSIKEIAWKLEERVHNYFIISCPCDWYFKKLNELAAKKPEAFANYMALKFLYFMHHELKSANHQHRHCVTQVRLAFTMVLSHFYMKEYFSKDDQKEVAEMITELQKSFTEMVESSDWLEERARKRAVETINSIDVSIGRLEDPISDIYIKEMVNLNLTNNYAANNLELARFKVDMAHYGFAHLGNLQRWYIRPIDLLKAILVNAFYNLVEHHINVLAGILLPPIYHRYMPQSMKYGALGYIVGHEVAHSLDASGRAFEKEYNQRDKSWSDEPKKLVLARSQCYGEHMMNYTVPVLQIKLNNTDGLTEAMADSNGLKASFLTYKRIVKDLAKSRPEDYAQKETLPGLELTPDQTFFLSFAQIFCAKYEPRHYWSDLFDKHPMDMYRVAASIQNSEDFSATYNCPVKSRMNLDQKCRLW